MKTKNFKKYEPVMVSDDGDSWYPGLYYQDNAIIYGVEHDGMVYGGADYKYIVALADFDFDNIDNNKDL